METPHGAPSSSQTTDEERSQAFTKLLRAQLADDGTSFPGMIVGYRAHVAAWVTWCQSEALSALDAAPAHIRAYRRSLVAAEYPASVIAHKLAVLRRFYGATEAAGLRADNPAAGIFPSDHC